MGGIDARAVDDGSPLGEKAAYFQHDLLEKHWLDGLYVSIVPHVPAGTRLKHTVDEPGNVIHAGVWTGRYLAGVGYQYAVTHDSWVREHGGQILKALRIQQEVTGKPGLLARGYVKGHGPVAGFERDGNDSTEWHQGQGQYADYRWYGDVSVDNFNAVLYGYAIYFDLAADKTQKEFIAKDVDRLLTHLLDNHCRIIDVDGQPTEWGHVGIDPDRSRDEYYRKRFAGRARAAGTGRAGAPSLRSETMLLPDLLIAYHITEKPRYLEMYRRVVDRFQSNPEPAYYRRPRSAERIARTNHSSEGQQYEALYNLVRYESDPKLLAIYRPWVNDLWDANWMEGNPLFTYMTLALLPEYRTAEQRVAGAKPPEGVPHAAEGLKLAKQTLALFQIDRVMHPVMNSIRTDIEFDPIQDRSRSRQAAKPLPINVRPLDNEYAWKGSPYTLDGYLKPHVTAMQFSCDDPQVAWFCDSSGAAYMTLDHGQSWRKISTGLIGASVRNLVASKDRTFVLWADCDKGIFRTRDGGLSWRSVAEAPSFPKNEFGKWLTLADGISVRLNKGGQIERTINGGKTSAPAMNGWRIPLARSLLQTPWGVVAGGPGGTYLSKDGQSWKEMSLWPEYETGAADYLHAYWMGRYYGFLSADGKSVSPAPKNESRG